MRVWACPRGDTKRDYQQRRRRHARRDVAKETSSPAPSCTPPIRDSLRLGRVGEGELAGPYR